MQRAGADRRLELPRRPLGDHLAVVDHGDALRELVGLLEVLRAEQDRRPARHQHADDVPHLVARARVEPGGRLVEEHELRGDDDAGRDVEPPPHPARVVLDQPRGGLGEAEGLEQLAGALLGRGAPQAEQPADAGSGSRGRSGPRRRRRAGRSGSPRRARRPASETMSCPSTRALPASGWISVASMRIVVVFPAPFGPEHAVHRAARHRQVDAVHGTRLAERLDQAGGFDRKGGHDR